MTNIEFIKLMIANSQTRIVNIDGQIDSLVFLKSENPTPEQLQWIDQQAVTQHAQRLQEAVKLAELERQLVQEVKGRIVPRLEAKGWTVRMDTEAATYYWKKSWCCRVPYTTKVPVMFWRMSEYLAAWERAIYQ